jgi:predicted ABC-type ATPase
LEKGKKFSFETVFSHKSKIDIMRQGLTAGYKVYLYFVSTESADINVLRVAARKAKGGHDVPEEKIRIRYSRSLENLFDAYQLAYQAFFFDNSVEGSDSKMFAHFKKAGEKKEWDPIHRDDIPNWFIKYYLNKIKPK